MVTLGLLSSGLLGFAAMLMWLLGRLARRRKVAFANWRLILIMAWGFGWILVRWLLRSGFFFKYGFSFEDLAVLVAIAGLILLIPYLIIRQIILGQSETAEGGIMKEIDEIGGPDQSGDPN